MEVNHDGFLRVMHVPEDSLAILIEGACRDDSGHVGSGHPYAVPPSACGVRVCSDSRNMDERYLKAALECPEFVSALNVQRQFAFRYLQIYQGDAPLH
jgi:hypothetical protein